mmetsp:Transcript_1476/g.4619  ORF Transcript_1476/g.4619 Transcript_1476/m.4619 type:complete len:239 (+) Transcript_1476:2210-2926(+)
MQFIDHQQTHALHVLALLPATTEHVPVLRGAHHQVAALQQTQIGSGLTGEQHHVQTEATAGFGRTQSCGPVGGARLCHLCLGHHVDGACTIVAVAVIVAASLLLLLLLCEHAEEGKLGDHLLAAARGCAQQHAVVAGVGGLEDLRLYGVEEAEAAAGVERLEARLGERTHRQRLQVEQLGGRRVLGGQQQRSEGDWQHTLGAEPAVGEHAHKVLRRQRLEERHRKVDVVRHGGVLALQ